MADIIGLHDKAAARIARREMPSLQRAKEILAAVDQDYVLSIARKVFDKPGSATPDELEILLADRRVKLNDA